MRAPPPPLLGAKPHSGENMLYIYLDLLPTIIIIILTMLVLFHSEACKKTGKSVICNALW